MTDLSLNSLTPHQRDILVRRATGQMPKQIGLELKIARSTAGATLTQVRDKLGFESIAALLAWAKAEAAAVQGGT